MLTLFLRSALLLAALPAAAATITLGGTPLGGQGITSAQPGMFVETFEGRPSVTISGDYVISDSSVPGKRAAPAGDASRYLAVPDARSSGEVRMAFPLARKPIRRIGLYWGSMDDYNSLSFLDASGKTIALGSYGLALSGGAVRAAAAASGDRVSAGSNRYVNIAFAPAEAFTTLVFDSSNYAFEIDNIAYSSRAAAAGSTPASEPAALALLGLGMGGLVLRRSRGRG